MRAVLVICEGNHDVAFVTRSLGALVNGADFFKGPINKLPTPFSTKHDPKKPTQPIYNGIIAERYGFEDGPDGSKKQKDINARNLREAARAPVPTFEAVMTIPADETLYVMLRCNGKDAAFTVVSLVENMRSLMAVGAEVDAVALAVIQDADQGLDGCEAKFSKDYAVCFESGPAGAPRHQHWVRGKHGPVGLFVFHDPSSATRAGTLEDVLAPLVHEQWPEKWAGADAYLRSHVEPADQIHREPADHKKAQIGVTGQFMFPGGPMTEVIGNRERGLSKERFTGPASRALVDFLLAVPW